LRRMLVCGSKIQDRLELWGNRWNVYRVRPSTMLVDYCNGYVMSVTRFCHFGLSREYPGDIGTGREVYFHLRRSQPPHSKANFPSIPGIRFRKRPRGTLCS
jgi:hypothetical protein